MGPDALSVTIIPARRIPFIAPKQIQCCFRARAGKPLTGTKNRYGTRGITEAS